MKVTIPTLNITCDCGRVNTLKATDFNICDDNTNSTFFSDCTYSAECKCGKELVAALPVSPFGRVLVESDIRKIKMLLENTYANESPMTAELYRTLEEIVNNNAEAL